MARNISETLKSQVRQRANGLCEYCHAIEKWQFVQFTIDHVMPVSQGGSNNLQNLALACFHCNRKKYVKSSAIDPETGIVSTSSPMISWEQENKSDRQNYRNPFAFCRLDFF